MYWLKLILLVVWLVGFPREGDACETRGEAQVLQSSVTAHVNEDAGASKKNPHPSERAHLVQRLAKRKPDVSLLSCATQNVFPSVTNRPLGRFYHSWTVGEDDRISLYRFLSVYRC